MRDRIRQGKPILVTDPDATRFFITVSEAASLVMKAATMALGGETFWLDMGPQIRIGDLAARLLDVAAAAGLAPVPIEVVGLRPGEKMTEELASPGIRLENTAQARVWVAHQASRPVANADIWLRTLRRSVARDDAYGAMTTLTLAIGDFVPSLQAWDRARASRAQIPAVVRAARPRPVERRIGEAAPRAPRRLALRRGPARLSGPPLHLAEVVPMPRRAGWL